MARIICTECCALSQLCCNNKDTIDDIKIEILDDLYYVAEECESQRKVSYYAVTTKTEKRLEKKLIKIGFEYKHSIPSKERPKEKLKIWFLTTCYCQFKKIHNIKD